MLRKLFAASVALLVLLPATGASAGQVPARGEGCVDQTFAPAFASFGDRRLYTAVPNGSFEDGTAGWEISGDATVVPHVNPFRAGASALQMGPGSVATSPAICVTHGYQSARAFVQRLTGGRASALRVEVLYPAHARKSATTKRAGALGGGIAFGPSRRFSLAQGMTSGSPVDIRFRLTVRGAGAFLVDDLLVDPRCRS